jgi:N-acetylmuramoyl-L-alanine amidase
VREYGTRHLFLPLLCILFALISFPVSGEASLGLGEVLAQLGTLPGTPVEFRWDPLLRNGAFTLGVHRAAFSPGVPGEIGFALVDGVEGLSLPLPWEEGGELRFPESFSGQIRAVLERRLAEDNSRFRIAAIIVDPGHGGRDTGAVGNLVVQGKPLRLVEKDIALKTARFLYDRLRGTYGDRRILLTRNDDSYPSLEDRVNLANAAPLEENEAVIFVSIHANASFNRKARGYEVWYLNPEYRRNVIDGSKYTDAKEVIPILNAMMEEEFTNESIFMAQFILKRIGEAVGKDMPSRGLKAEEWFVVKNSRMPAVLVELGFVTNEEDGILMADDAYLKNLAEALYKGISDFIALFERSGGFTAISE